MQAGPAPSLFCMERFLELCRAAFERGVAGAGRVRVVSGNQSADLDLVVLAVTYAYCEVASGGSALPLVNIPRRDLMLRRDILLALERVQVAPEKLYFVEDFGRLPRHLVDLVLVDHCAPQGELREMELVVGIVDHHEDEQRFMDAVPRIIKPLGSCLLLVFNYWWDRLDNPVAVLAPLVPLVVAPLLNDTNNMQLKVTEDDRVAFEHYGLLAPAVDFAAYALALKKEKKNLAGFSFADVLRKDYKLYVVPTASGRVTVGISSLPLSFTKLFQQFPDVEAAVDAYGREHQLDLVVLMASDKKTRFERQLALHDYSGGQLASAVAAGLQAQLELSPWDTSFPTLQCYSQGNVAASRKQVAPAVQEFFRSHI